MKIVVKRTNYLSDCTIGEMYVDGKYECFTLEDVVRDNGVKVSGATAIPTGSYSLTVTFSNRFQKELPLLLNVPNFEGVRIHTGNTSLQTEGCILIGRQVESHSILESRLAFEHLFPKIKAALAKGDKITLTIS